MSNRTQRSLGLILMVAVAVLPALAADTATAVYDKKCKVCHGANGEGNPGMAKMLKVTITPSSSAEVQKTSDVAFVRSLKK